MTARGYTDTQKIEDYLGLTFTQAQADQAEAMIERAEQFIDQYTRRGWLLDAITGERHELTRGLTLVSSPLYPPARLTIQLARYPIEAAGIVVTGRRLLDPDAVTLEAGTDFEADTAAGILIFADGTASLYDYLLVDYRPYETAMVPPVVELAATMLAAHYMGTALGRPLGATRLTADDMTVQWERTTDGGVPAEITALLAGYRQPVLFA